VVLERAAPGQNEEMSRTRLPVCFLCKSKTLPFTRLHRFSQWAT